MSGFGFRVSGFGCKPFSSGREDVDATELPTELAEGVAPSVECIGKLEGFGFRGEFGVWRRLTLPSRPSSLPWCQPGLARWGGGVVAASVSWGGGSEG